MSKEIPSPKPETVNAYLPSYGYTDRRATLHTFQETRETEVDGPAFEFVFKCIETGAERRWGLVDRFVFKDMGN
jgi:hypothetical protein